MFLILVLCGNIRFPEKFREPTLITLGTRIRVRTPQKSTTKEQFKKILNKGMAKAGNANLITKELTNTHIEHAVDKYRVMMIMANNFLSEAMGKDVD